MFAELIVASMCATTTGTYHTACDKATQATYMTVGADRVENRLQTIANDKAIAIFGQDVYNVGGAITVTTAKTIKDKSVTYKIKTKKKSFFLGTDYVKPEMMFRPGDRGGGIGFGWSW